MTTLATSVHDASSAGTGPSTHGPSTKSAGTSGGDATQHRPLAGWQMDRTGSLSDRTGTADAAVDVMALLGRCLGNFDLIIRVVSRFRKTGGSDLEQLALAIHQEDFAAVVKIAHRFKGAAGNISAAGLHKIAAGMEQAGRDQDAAQLPGLVSQLRAEWAEFLRFADAFAPPGGVSQVQPVK